MLRASERAGYYVTQDEGYRAFEPCALPPVPPLDLVGGGLLGLLSAADVAVGRLDGSAGSLPDANLFLAMYVRQEALLSSQIERTVACPCAIGSSVRSTQPSFAVGEGPRSLRANSGVRRTGSAHSGVRWLRQRLSHLQST